MSPNLKKYRISPKSKLTKIVRNTLKNSFFHTQTILEKKKYLEYTIIGKSKSNQTPILCSSPQSNHHRSSYFFPLRWKGRTTIS